MEQFQIVKSNNKSELKIVCMGIGKAGCNAIEHLSHKALNKIDFIAIGTDAQSLEQINGIKKIQIGAKKSKGLGSGMKPDIGRECTIESYDTIKIALHSADMVLIVAGFGGGTGTGASPIIAKIAKEVGALTVSIITMPFKFEGRKRLKIAENGVVNMKKESDSIVIIQNEKLLSSIDKKLTLLDGFKTIDTAIGETINGIVGIVLSSGENDINLDFADLKTVMSYRGMALMGVSEGKGENPANEAISQALKYALAENISLEEAKGILFHFYIHPDFSIINIVHTMELIYDNIHDEADIIWGTTTDETLHKEYVKATIILTGFEINCNNLFAVNNDSYEW